MQLDASGRKQVARCENGGYSRNSRVLRGLASLYIRLKIKRNSSLIWGTGKIKYILPARPLDWEHSRHGPRMQKINLISWLATMSNTVSTVGIWNGLGSFPWGLEPSLTGLEERTVQIGNEVPLWIFAPNKVAHSLGMAMTPTQLT